MDPALIIKTYGIDDEHGSAVFADAMAGEPVLPDSGSRLAHYPFLPPSEGA